MTDSIKQQFIDALATSLTNGSFVKLSLGKSQDSHGLAKAIATRITIQGEAKLKVVSKYATRDVTTNFEFRDAIEQISIWLGTTFLVGNLFTIDNDVTLFFNRRGKPKIKTSRASSTEKPSSEHNRAKHYLVSLDRPYLRELGIADHEGKLKPSMASKYKQIQRFIEIIDSLLREGSAQCPEKLSIVDIGSGKGYLTFALYDYLTDNRKISAKTEGIEVRDELVRKCQKIADQLGYGRLNFRCDQAATFTANDVDMVIALHACDTATDDAIFRGIAANATWIVCAPCCQHELAPQLSSAHPALQGLHRFGLLRQRQADLVTDTARALLLEANGYRVKVIEFISTEHTAKNLMLAAVRSEQVDRQAAKAQYLAMKELFGFQSFSLEQRFEQLSVSLPINS